MKRRSFLLTLALFALILLPIIFACSCGGDELSSGDITVELNSSGKKLNVRVMPDRKLLNDHEKDKLCLFGFAPGESVEDGFEGKTPLDSKSAKDEVSFKIPLSDSEGSLLYYSFAAAFYDEDADEYVTATNYAAFVSNPYELSENNSDFPESESIKGICAEYDTDAEALGVSHAVIDIPVNKYVLASGDSDAIVHTVGRRSVFIDDKAIGELDRRVKYYTEKDVAVYLRFTLKASAEELPEGLKYLAYPGTEAGEPAYALNMNDRDAAEAVAALADFLAERYAIEEGEQGSICAFIAGEGLNSPGATAGDTGYGDYFEGASLLVRTLYTAMASHYENGRVYVSVDHRWKIAGSGGADTSGISFLNELSKKSRDEGDYPWGVAASIRSNSADRDKLWYDSSDGEYLSASNIEAVGNDFLASSKNCYEDAERNFIVSDFYVETSGDGESESNQAASYAYAYYKAVDTERIDALIYSHQVDTETLSAGLRERTDDGLPGAAREIYSVMRDIDTDADIRSAVNGVIPSDFDWSSLYKKHSELVMLKKSVGGKGKAVEIKDGDDEPLDGYKSEPLYDFCRGSLNGFKTAGNGSYAGVTENGLEICFANPSSAEIGYAYCAEISKSDLKNDSVIIKLAKITDSCSVTLTLIQKNGDKPDVIYRSTVSGIPSGNGFLLDFDISEFRDEMKGGDIELRISAVGDEGGASSLTVSEILTGKEKSNAWLVALLIVLSSAALVAIGVLAVIWFRKHYKIEIDRSSKKTKTQKNKKSDDAEFYE